MQIKVLKCSMDGTQRLVEEEVPDDYFDVPEPVRPPTNEELATENHQLRSQVAALTDRGDFQEELIVELASVVYA